MGSSQGVVLLVKPSQNGVAVWESNPTVKTGWQRVSSLRRAGRAKDADEASRQLADIYNEQLRASVDEELRQVSGFTDPSRRSAEVWKMVNCLTGRKALS